MNPEETLLSTTDAARLKGCTRQAIRQNIDAGRLTAVQLGRFWYVVRDGRFDAFQPVGGMHARETDREG